MGIPLMIQEQDHQRIEKLKKSFGIKKKVDVVRAALDLLEKEAGRLSKVKQWKKAVQHVMLTSKEINEDFKKYSRIKHDS